MNASLKKILEVRLPVPELALVEGIFDKLTKERNAAAEAYNRLMRQSNTQEKADLVKRNTTLANRNRRLAEDITHCAEKNDYLVSENEQLQGTLAILRRENAQLSENAKHEQKIIGELYGELGELYTKLSKTR